MQQWPATVSVYNMNSFRLLSVNAIWIKLMQFTIYSVWVAYIRLFCILHNYAIETRGFYKIIQLAPTDNETTNRIVLH